MTGAYGGGTMEVLEHIPRAPISYEQWLAMPETSSPVDVVAGVPIMSPAPQGLHQYVLENLFGMLLGACPEGLRPAISPRDWVLWQIPLHVRQPDLMVVTVQQARAPRLDQPPLLAVEVLSPTSRERDLVTKPAEYAKAGLRHLWLVDPAVPEMVSKRWDGEAWIEVGRATSDQALALTAPFEIIIVPSALLR
jgi:Uma2 family endonuclease